MARGRWTSWCRPPAPAGITTLAVTEHYPLTPAFDPKAYLAMPQESVRPYLEALEAARAAYPDIEILFRHRAGLAGGLRGPRPLRRGPGPLRDRAGIGALRGRVALRRPGAAGPLGRAGCGRRHLEALLRAVVRRRHVRRAPSRSCPIPTWPRSSATIPLIDVGPLYRQAAEAAASAGRMVEVNTSGSYYACKEMFPAPALLGGVLPRGRALHRGHRRAHASERGARHRGRLPTHGASRLSNGNGPDARRRPAKHYHCMKRRR